jgi:hypothetical protein
MYKGEQAEFRSLVNYFMNARVLPRFQWTIEGSVGKGIKGEEHLQYYADEKMLKVINQRILGSSADFFDTELRIIETTFAYFLGKGTNIILNGNPTKVVHAAMMNLSELLSSKYSQMFIKDLHERDTKYKLLLDIILESKNHFNLLILTLKSIANKEFDSFLDEYADRALIIDGLKKMNPHLYVIDFLVDPSRTMDKIQGYTSRLNLHAQNGQLLEDIDDGVSMLLNGMFPNSTIPLWHYAADITPKKQEGTSGKIKEITLPLTEARKKEAT